MPLFFTPEFQRNLRQLAKRYRRIKSDLQPIIDLLAHGQPLRDRIAGIDFEVYKIRVQNSDAARGKRGGYRVIAQKTAEPTIILITIYAKTKQSDIHPHEIRDLITTYEAQQSETDNETRSETGADEGERTDAS